MNRLKQIAIAIDQLFNAILAGWADETLSSRCYRCGVLAARPKKRWILMRKAVDALFFFDKQHCETSYISEQRRNHLPPAMRSHNKSFNKRG